MKSENTLVKIELIKMAFSIIAIVWVAFEYYSNVHQKKVDRSFDFADRYLSSNIFQAHNAYNSIILDDDFLNLMEELISEKIDSETFSLKTEKIVEETEDEIKLDVFTLTEFYVDLAKCLNDDRCDVPTSCTFFANKVDSFVYFYGQKVKYWEDTLLLDPQFELLQKLTETCRPYLRES